ncbi:MAG: hypothetical protein ACHP9V_00965 [Terriglobales bacterium]
METAVRPRVASLFEPVRNGDVGLRDAPASQSVETAIHREVNVESEGERKMSHPAPALQEDRKVSDAKQSADESPVAAMVPPRGDSERRRTTVLADETREKEDKVVVAKVRPRKAPLSQDNADESEPAPPESEAFAPKHVPARTPAASTNRNESFEKSHRGLLLPPNVSLALTAQMKNAALAMNGGLSAPKREKAGIASPALAAEPEPSVHVTIGRIEVRASSERESKPVGRPRPASPVMSLEEYLHRRTQRGGQ